MGLFTEHVFQTWWWALQHLLLCILGAQLILPSHWLRLCGHSWFILNHPYLTHSPSLVSISCPNMVPGILYPVPLTLSIVWLLVCHYLRHKGKSYSCSNKQKNLLNENAIITHNRSYLVLSLLLTSLLWGVSSGSAVAKNTSVPCHGLKRIRLLVSNCKKHRMLLSLV